MATCSRKAACPHTCEKINWRSGLPEPQTVSGVPSPARECLRARPGPIKALTPGQVCFVDQPRNHVAILHVKVVVGAVNVGRDDARELAAMLLVVAPAGQQKESVKKRGACEALIWFLQEA